MGTCHLWVSRRTIQSSLRRPESTSQRPYFVAPERFLRDEHALLPRVHGHPEVLGLHGHGNDRTRRGTRPHVQPVQGQRGLHGLRGRG
jgi:hypothetical protein